MADTSVYVASGADVTAVERVADRVLRKRVSWGVDPDAEDYPGYPISVDLSKKDMQPGDIDELYSIARQLKDEIRFDLGADVRTEEELDS